MRRRDFFGLAAASAAAASPLTRVWADNSKLPTIGFLLGFSQQSELPFLPGFSRGLKETGYIEGSNVAIEYGAADLHLDRLPRLADQFVRERVAAIVSTGGVKATAAAIQATKIIPIVFIGGVDPVKLGWVKSIAHPGGNVTGVSFLSNALEAKRLALLHDAIPSVKIVGILVNPQNPTAQQQTKDLTDAAHQLGLTLHFAHASQESDLEPAFHSMMQRGAQAVAVATDASFISWRNQFVALTTGARVPAIFHDRDFVVRGALLSYGANITEAHRLAGVFAGRILKGHKPSDLPVQQSTKVEFVINLATAKALGLTIPSAVMAIADEVIG